MPKLARALDTSVAALIGEEAATEGRMRRGPVSRLERQLNALSKLPKSKQRFVSELIDAALARKQDA